MKKVDSAGNLAFGSSGSSSSNAVETINSNQAGPVLIVKSTGQLTSDGYLTILSNGSVALNGKVSAAMNLTVQTTANNGSIFLLESPKFLRLKIAVGV